MVRVYLAQMHPTLHDKKTNLEKIEKFMDEAANQDADLILFPELALTGYFTREKTPELAEDTNGESISLICKYAQKYKLKVVIGFPEKKKGEFYNSACFIDENGLVIGTYQKTHLWGEEPKYFKAGSDFPVWDTNIGKIGIMICFDTEFPECARELAMNGAEIILAPTANMLPCDQQQRIFIKARAAENQVFVFTTNRIGVEETTTFFGESAAASPTGETLVLADRTESGYLVEINLNEIAQARKDYHYLKQIRPSIYTNKGGVNV
jgi:5-aminopentanamidase